MLLFASATSIILPPTLLIISMSAARKPDGSLTLIRAGDLLKPMISRRSLLPCLSAGVSLAGDRTHDRRFPCRDKARIDV